jgi:hypothetical protein
MAFSFPFPIVQIPPVGTNGVSRVPNQPQPSPTTVSPTQLQNLSLGLAGLPQVSGLGAQPAPAQAATPPVASVTATPKPAQLLQSQPQQQQVPEIFKAIRPIEAAATRMTGWDPRNPPSANTISEAQFLRMNKVQQDNYLSMAERRVQMILQAKTKWEDMVNMGLEEAISGRQSKTTLKDQSRIIERKNVAEELLNKVETKMTEWQVSVNDGLSNGFLRYDPNTKLYQANDPKYNSFAREINAKRPQLEQDMRSAQRAHEDALKHFSTIQGVAVQQGLSIEPESPKQPGAQVPNYRYNPATKEYKPY